MKISIVTITFNAEQFLRETMQSVLKQIYTDIEYIIVDGKSTDGFDMARGKINVKQTLMERIEAVKNTGLADEIIVEEYEGQKIDYIRRYDVDIFTVGSDWKGHFDYLNEFCKVVYLDRTQGVSSSELRAEKRELRLGLVGESPLLNKFEAESQYVNGVTISGVSSQNTSDFNDKLKTLPLVTRQLDELIDASDAVYIVSYPSIHYEQTKMSLTAGKHVLCESPITISVASLKVGKGVKLDGEGIRYEIVSFLKAIQSDKDYQYIIDVQSVAVIKL